MTFAQQRNERIFVVKRCMTVLCGILEQKIRDVKLAFCMAINWCTGTGYLNADNPREKVRDGNSCTGNVENKTL